MFLIWMLSSVRAEPEYFVISPEEVKEYDLLLEAAAGMSSPQASHIGLLVEEADGRLVPATEYLEPLLPVPEKEPLPAPSNLGTDNPGASEGALTGKAVYLSQCHGWIWSDYHGTFYTQRDAWYETVEDFHNPEGMNQYLANYLENAGASVFTVKERDLNPDMALVDNGGGGYSESGSGFSDGPSGFADASPWAYGENPFEAGSTRRFPADGGASASWIPEVPEDGYYAVYASWDSEPDNARNAHYRIRHNGGDIDRYFDQTVHGSTWQYMETLWLEEGVDSLEVELLGDGTETGRYLIADAVRIGGGVGDVSINGQTSGRPRWEEGARLHTQYNGAPTTVYGYSDHSARGRWASWEHPSGEDAVYLSWHSNASEQHNGTGTETYHNYNTSGAAGFASHVQDALMDTIRTGWDSDWADRGVRTADFSEVSPSYNTEFPAILIELGFHDASYDVSFLKEPLFRMDASRAMYQGIVRYFAELSGESPVFLPEPPVGLRTEHRDGGVWLSWEPGLSGSPYGDASTGFIVYRSQDGRSWDNGEEVSESSLLLGLSDHDSVFLRVAGVNSGGVSFPSEVVGVHKDPEGLPPILIVSAFDRLEASSLYSESAGMVGSVKRMDLRKINPYDTAVAHGAAVDAMGWAFDSVSDEVIGEVDLSGYAVVIWIAGEESTTESTFTEDDQQLLRSFWEGGGQLFVSGSEIFWDLDERGTEGDRDFAAVVLGALMASDDAGTEGAYGAGILDGLDLAFSVQDGSPYHVEYPDVLASDRTPIALYDGGEVAAVMGAGVVTWGFPFECIGSASVRNSAMAIVLGAMLTDYEPPAGDTAEEEEADTGIIALDTGSSEGFPSLDKESTEDLGRKGCSCSTSGDAKGWALHSLVLMFLLVARRYRWKNLRQIERG
jgi:MYXO-CTERM domain-containing protein